MPLLSCCARSAQAWHPRIPRPSTPSAGKLGDDDPAGGAQPGGGKAQFDLRLPPAEVEATRARLLALAAAAVVVAGPASAALAAAYAAVTRGGVLS